MQGISEKRVLVVDDTDLIRELLMDFFTLNGYETVTAKNGNEALNVLTQKHFNMLVTDLNMPVMNGIELIRTVRNLNIFLTIIGMSAAEKEREFLKAGADYFLPKPFDFTYLKCVLNSVFGS